MVNKVLHDKKKKLQFFALIHKHVYKDLEKTFCAIYTFQATPIRIKLFFPYYLLLQDIDFPASCRIYIDKKISIKIHYRQSIKSFSGCKVGLTRFIFRSYIWRISRKFFREFALKWKTLIHIYVFTCCYANYYPTTLASRLQP